MTSADSVFKRLSATSWKMDSTRLRVEARRLGELSE